MDTPLDVRHLASLWRTWQGSPRSHYLPYARIAWNRGDRVGFAANLAAARTADIRPDLLGVRLAWNEAKAVMS